MKKLLPAIVVICISAVSVKAQQPADSSHHFRSRVMQHRHFDMMQQLHLSDDQKQQMQSINEDFRNKMKDLDKNEDITVREWKKKRADIMKERRNAVQNVFTPEQKEKMKQMRQTASARMHEISEKRLEKMKTQLNLTDGQVTKIRSLSDNLKSQIKTIHENNSLSLTDKRDQVIALIKQHQQDFKNVLTQEQVSKLEEIRKDRSEKRLGR
ncbi:MAG TPA: hypothetical protein VMT76_12170 [Puia sp.]|nr:hypothetical protein [Puia sp.]